MAATATTPALTPQAWRPSHNPWAVALTVTLATFMEVLDTSIANVALPHMAGSLGASQEEATWVLTSYLVSSAIVLPISGWLSNRFGRKRFYMTCVALFTVCSLLCGLAPVAAASHLRPHSARRRRRRPRPQRTGHPRRHLPRRKARPGLRRLRHGRRRRARHRPHARRLDHRQLQLALDLLHQPAGRPALALSSATAWSKTRRTSRHANEACQALKVDFMGLGLVAIGVGFLEFVLDKGQEKDWFGVADDPSRSVMLGGRHARRLRHLGVEPRRPHRRPQAAEEPQLRHRRLPATHPRHGALRLDRAHPAVSAGPARATPPSAPAWCSRRPAS